MTEELILVPEVQARRALRNHALRLHVLAPHGAWLGCGVLRVLRLKILEDQSAEIVAGYESYRAAMTTSLAEARTAALGSDSVPRHVAIIMDGNRRWAKSRGLPAIEGHRRGMVALRHVTRAASDFGIRVLTVYGFSTENWNRSAGEISLLFELCVAFARNELIELQRNGVRVRVIGEWESLPAAPRAALADLQAQTAGNTGLSAQSGGEL